MPILLALVAQLAGATLTGSVRDAATGDPLAGVVVSLPEAGRASVTDARGRYELLAVAAGPQHVRLERIGYRTRVLHALVPPAGRLTIDVALRGEPVPLPGVAVRGPAVTAGSAADAPPSERARSAAALRDDPLLGEPDALEGLAGGVVVVSPEAPTGVHIRGGASDHTAFTLDGIPILNPVHAAGMFGAWNPDALLAIRTESDAPSAAGAVTLSGTVAAETRPVARSLEAIASVSTMQARLTIGGPVGTGGWLLALRSGLPDALAPRDASHLRGETGDALAKVDAKTLGGDLRLLWYESRDELGAAARAGDTDPGGAERHAFEWGSRSLGATWRRGGVHVRLWHARADADALWAAAAPERLAWERRDEGLLVSVDRGSATSGWSAGARLERSRARYRVSGADATAALRATTPSLVVYGGRRVVMGALTLAAEASLLAGAGEARLGPRVRLGWAPAPGLTLVASAARTHQLAQSLRNPESMVGTVFPPDLHVGASGDGVPVAASDQFVIAAGVRLSDAVRATAQAYTRAMGDLLLVAPEDGGPFSSGDFDVGSARARGLALEVDAGGTRWSASASWLWQRVRYRGGDAAYVPAHGTAHLLETGATVFPAATASVRLGVAAGFGRRGTVVPGGFEWEACNLLDQGCEFAGSPDYAGQTPGTARLPSYVRVDVGVRKHWHVRPGGRDALVALFGTVTNLLGRRNVLTYAADPDTGAREKITMRPFAPLVAGLEVRF